MLSDLSPIMVVLFCIAHLNRSDAGLCLCLGPLQQLLINLSKSTSDWLKKMLKAHAQHVHVQTSI